MQRCSFHLILLLTGTVTDQFTTNIPYRTSPIQWSTESQTTEVQLSSPKLVADPVYPVVEGQTVHLFCNSSSVPPNVSWAWDLYQGQWKEVDNKINLALSKPKESGLYRCRAKSRSSLWLNSSGHSVYIISMHQTDGEKLGIAAFALSLLLLIIILVVLSWFVWERLRPKPNASLTTVKVFPGPQKSPKEGLQEPNDDGDVYINYTGDNLAYSDLDPTNMADENVYSSLG